MWQLVVLSVLLTTAFADIQNFHGNWTSVMQFPDYFDSPTCLHFSVSEENDKHCSCNDGKVSTSWEFYFLYRQKSEDFNHVSNIRKSFPVIEAKTAAEVLSALGGSCSCGSTYTSRVVVRRINNDYFVLYQDNIAILQARIIQTASEIQNIANQVDNLSGRKGRVVCSQV